MAGVYYVLDAASGKVVKELVCGEPIFSTPRGCRRPRLLRHARHAGLRPAPRRRGLLGLGPRQGNDELLRRPVERRGLGPLQERAGLRARPVLLLDRHRRLQQDGRGAGGRPDHLARRHGQHPPGQRGWTNPRLRRRRVRADFGLSMGPSGLPSCSGTGTTTRAASRSSASRTARCRPSPCPAPRRLYPAAPTTAPTKPPRTTWRRPIGKKKGRPNVASLLSSYCPHVVTSTCQVLAISPSCFCGSADVGWERLFLLVRPSGTGNPLISCQ